MNQENQEINWDDIMRRFSSRTGNITTFCKENNIRIYQLRYQRAKLQKENVVKFHGISINKDEMISEIKNESQSARNEVIIQIGKAKVLIPVSESALLTALLKELIPLC